MVFPPCLSNWGNLGWLVEICKGCVAFSQTVLDSLKSAEVVSIVTVVEIPPHLAPGQEEHRNCARILGSDSLHYGLCFRKNIVINLNKTLITHKSA